MDIKELYQEIILDHGKNPRNKNICKDFNKDAKGHNPLCGDKVHIFLKLNNEKKLEDISFEGEGCAISMASASIMTEIIKGKQFNIAKIIQEDILNINGYGLNSKWKLFHTANDNFNGNFDYFIELAFKAFCLLYTSPSPRDRTRSRMPSSA